jgi:uncharacterized peroxidase-related enzyme
MHQLDDAGGVLDSLGNDQGSADVQTNMPHIDLPTDLPGILGPMAFRPETAKPLNELVEVLLRGDHSLSRGERELIAAHVSRLNRTQFCEQAHGTFAALQLDGGWEVVDSVFADIGTAKVSEKMKALLRIATAVQAGGLEVTSEMIEAARAEGATDIELHDTVLIAAAFCMYNRYVDGLATWAPPNREDYEDNGRRVVEHGYAQMPEG